MEKFVADVKTKNYVVGARQVNRLLAENGLQKVYLASDCDAEFSSAVKSSAKQGGVAVVSCGTRAEIAKVCGIEVPCAVVGILK